MSERKTHLSKIEGGRATACGTRSTRNNPTTSRTSDESLVTCEKCLVIIRQRRRDAEHVARIEARA